MDRKEVGKGATVLEVGRHDGKPSKAQVGVVQPRTGQFLKPQPLDRSPTAIAPSDDPRVKLAAWMTDPNNEYFSGAMVNRLWRHYLGVGLVEPVDDLRASNPPTNPALWEALNKEFVVAPLRPEAHDAADPELADLPALPRRRGRATRRMPRFYSHYYARRLPAEVLLDALTQSTGVPDEFPGYPVGLRAGQLPDPTMKSYFLTLFGRSERVTACACERNGEVTMPQLLHLQNGDERGRERCDCAERPAGTELLKTGKPEAEIIEELFLATLSKPADGGGKDDIHQALAAKDAKPEEVFRDLFWALLNSKEFAFNH